QEYRHHRRRSAVNNSHLHERGQAQRLSSFFLSASDNSTVPKLVSAVSFFIASYLAALLVASFVTRQTYWSMLIAAIVATTVTNFAIDRGTWCIGFFVAPQFALRDLLLGACFAMICIGAGDALIVAASKLHHIRGDGFPWRELLVVYAPAALHVAHVFRGYLFQYIT